MSEDNTGSERRRFSRIPFDAGVVVERGGKTWQAQVIDISLTGLLITIPDGWQGQAGEEYVIDIVFQGGGEIIGTKSVVSHVEPALNQVGFHIEEIDLAGISHLRRLVELNLGDEALLNRELSALGAD